ncbi:MAG: DUF4240 domain-containing protein [Proteobacteria bacterium]|nr:DUF4240 domain-containing protein [Pseudomonadota bacterium]
MRRRSFLTLAAIALTPSLATAAAAMSDDRFWTIIDRTARFESQPDRQAEALRSELSVLTASEVAAFDATFEQQMRRAYHWDLWGAASVANGGASDDGFVYFRLWLVSKGRRAFEQTLGDPDSLADLKASPGPDGVYEFEAFGYVARKVLAAKGIGDGAGLPDGDPTPTRPRGDEFKDDPAWLAAHYPKLWRRFGNHPLGSKVGLY